MPKWQDISLLYTGLGKKMLAKVGSTELLGTGERW